MTASLENRIPFYFTSNTEVNNIGSVHWSEKHFFRKVLPKEKFRFVYRGGGQKTLEQVSLTFFNYEFFPTPDRRLKKGKIDAHQEAPSTCRINLTG